MDKKKFDFVAQVVDAALIQAAESSRLRDWLIFHGLKFVETMKNEPNLAEMLLEFIGDDLIGAFDAMIDPDDDEFFDSILYKSDPSVSDLPYDMPEMTWEKSSEQERSG